MITRRVLGALAIKVNEKWDCGATWGSDSLIPMGCKGLDILEHVVHELAHGVLLGVATGPDFSSRIGQAVRAMGGLNEEDTDGYRDGIRLQDENEVETFAVEIAVLQRLGFKVDLGVMVDAAIVQVSEWTPKEVRDYWAAFKKSNEYRAATQEVLAALLSQRRTP